MTKKFMLLTVILGLGLGSALHAGDGSNVPDLPAERASTPLLLPVDWEDVAGLFGLVEEDSKSVDVAAVSSEMSHAQLSGQEAGVRTAVKRLVPDYTQSASQHRRIDPSAVGEAVARVCQWQGCRDCRDQHVFATDQEFYDHANAHSVGVKECRWGSCALKLSSFASLRTHIFTHTREKPYKCNEAGCDSAFSRANSLTEHARIHTGEKPYMCDFPGCCKACTQFSNLTRHKRIHTGEKPYMCDFPGCGKACAQFSTLTVHKRVHTGEKPYVCKKCDKAYVSSTALSLHKRTKH